MSAKYSMRYFATVGGTGDTETQVSKFVFFYFFGCEDNFLKSVENRCKKKLSKKLWKKQSFGPPYYDKIFICFLKSSCIFCISPNILLEKNFFVQILFMDLFFLHFIENVVHNLVFFVSFWSFSMNGNHFGPDPKLIIWIYCDIVERLSCLHCGNR